jgi:hypothetical protein
MQRIVFSLFLALAFTFTFAVVGFSDVPPPPVNQIIGIPDTTFNNLEEARPEHCR